MSAVALFDFDPTNEAELGLKTGDVICPVEIVDDEWMIGECKGKRGAFPASYVQLSGAGEQHTPSTGPQPQPPQQQHAPQQHAPQQHAPQQHAPQQHPPQQHPPQQHPPQQQQEAHQPEGTLDHLEAGEVLYDFVAENVEELDCKQGDRVYILCKLSPEWLRVRHQHPGAKAGVVPSNYIEDKGPVVATALYDNTAQSAHELNFTAGEVVVLIEAEEGAEWWQGMTPDGSRGAFPANYVQRSEL